MSKDNTPAEHRLKGLKIVPEQQRSWETLAKINEATRFVLSTTGRDWFKTSQVAAKSGKAESTIYHYFPTRTSLLDYVWPNREDTFLYGYVSPRNTSPLGLTKVPKSLDGWKTVWKLEDAAGVVLATIGRDEFTRKDLAEAAGATTSVTHSYFKHKSDVLARVWPERKDTFLRLDTPQT